MPRSPLWQLRKRSYDLLSVASRYPSFPLLLEAYRECLRDVFDMPALIETLRAIEQRQLRVHVVETRKPSPFASSLLFSYVANFLYDGDAPLAERRAQALTIDQDQLRELLGEADLRELLDADAIAEVEETAQCLAENYRARSADGIHDLCLRLGDLSRDELRPPRRLARSARTSSTASSASRRLLELRIAGERRLDRRRRRSPLSRRASAFRCRPAWPPRCSSRSRIPCSNWCAATRAPTARSRCARLPTASRSTPPPSRTRCASSPHEGRVLEGGFRPGGLHREWCDAEILRQIRRKSLARLRREVEPVEQHTLARFLTHWQGLLAPRRAARASRRAARRHRKPAGRAAARVAARDRDPPRAHRRLRPCRPRHARSPPAKWPGPASSPSASATAASRSSSPTSCRCSRSSGPIVEPLTEREEKLLAVLESTGASFFDPLHQAVGGGYPGETIDALWSLVWRGLITNDSLHALRAYIARPESARTPRRLQTGAVFRSRRTTPPTAQGRWSLLPLRASSAGNRVG